QDVQLCFPETEFISHTCLETFLVISIIQFINKCTLVKIAIDLRESYIRLYPDIFRRLNTKSSHYVVLRVTILICITAVTCAFINTISFMNAIVKVIIKLFFLSIYTSTAAKTIKASITKHCISIH